ncbi:succinate dehydrogenase assembly factor 2-A, mitochondrial [Exaiptasia diaphana]|uniref:Succinate dehydrogenase assembly factor 2, mitochondrial n=1 Tax=Exaiptasia diaphana TaxID=2652724 RepID=A0A913YAJ4_EXADI|nr:succinate dehydrogenase assembly factor 2-A, mitochondrial [Exaiptasia diaphana]
MSDRVIDPPYLGPPVPNYKVREGESVETKRSRLLYQSRKRGMLENGLLLSTFANKYLKNFDKESLELYDKLINQPSNDWDLYYWMIENQPTPEEYNNSVMDLLKEHAKNEKRDVRLRQPDLEGA